MKLTLFILVFTGIWSHAVDPSCTDPLKNIGEKKAKSSEPRQIIPRDSIDSMTESKWEELERDVRQFLVRSFGWTVIKDGEDRIQTILTELIAGWDHYQQEADQFGERAVIKRLSNLERSRIPRHVGLFPNVDEVGANEGEFVEDYRNSEDPGLDWKSWFQTLTPLQTDVLVSMQRGHLTPLSVAEDVGLTNWQEAVEIVRGLDAPDANVSSSTDSLKLTITQREGQDLQQFLEGQRYTQSWFYDDIRYLFGIAELGVKDVRIRKTSSNQFEVTLPIGPYSFKEKKIVMTVSAEDVFKVTLGDLNRAAEKAELDPVALAALKYRYWKRLPVKGVARRLDLPWKMVSQILSKSSEKINSHLSAPRVNFKSFELAPSTPEEAHAEEKSLKETPRGLKPLSRVSLAPLSEGVRLSEFQLGVVWDWRVQAGSLSLEAHNQGKRGEAIRSAFFTGAVPKISKVFGQDRLLLQDISILIDPEDPRYPIAMVRHNGKWVPVKLRAEAPPLASSEVRYVLSQDSLYRLVQTLPRSLRPTALLMFEDRLSDFEIMKQFGIAPNVIEKTRWTVVGAVRRHLGKPDVSFSEIRMQSEEPTDRQRQVVWPEGPVPLRVSPKDLESALAQLSQAERDYARLRIEGWSTSEIAEFREVTEHTVSTLNSVSLRKLGDILGWTQQVDRITPRDIVVLQYPEGSGRKRTGGLRPIEAEGTNLVQQIRHYLSQRQAGGDARVSFTGLAKMAQDLGLEDMNTAYHAAVVVVGPEVATKRRWAPFPGSPALALRVRRALQSKQNAERYAELDGLQQFADRFFEGDLTSAWEGARAAMGESRFETELNWGIRPTPRHEGTIRLAEVESRAGEALHRSTGQLRAALELGEPSLSRVYRSAQSERLTPSFRHWVRFDGTPGEWWLLQKGLWNEDGTPLAHVTGQSGLEGLAETYFGGRQRLVELSAQALTPEQQAALAWQTNEGSSPSGTPVTARWLPVPKTDAPELSPVQRTAVAEYIQGYLDTGKPPTVNALGESAITRLSRLFGDLPRAHVAIQQYADHFGIPLKVVEGIVETPPNEELREIWRRQAVDLYIEWMLRNGGKIPTQPDWGRGEASRVGVDQARMFGADVYGEGRPQHAYRIFDSQQAALIAVHRRAQELGVPFSLMDQKFRSSNDTPPELRAAWQREARQLLERWRDANPGTRPVATAWGKSEGKVGMTYKRFFGQARNPKEWVFETREEADAMMEAVFSGQ